MEGKYRNLGQEFETATRQFKEYELSVKNKFEGELSVTINNLRS